MVHWFVYRYLLISSSSFLALSFDVQSPLPSLCERLSACAQCAVREASMPKSKGSGGTGSIRFQYQSSSNRI